MARAFKRLCQRSQHAGSPAKRDGAEVPGGDLSGRVTMAACAATWTALSTIRTESEWQVHDKVVQDAVVGEVTCGAGSATNVRLQLWLAHTTAPGIPPRDRRHLNLMYGTSPRRVYGAMRWEGRSAATPRSFRR